MQKARSTSTGRRCFNVLVWLLCFAGVTAIFQVGMILIYLHLTGGRPAKKQSHAAQGTGSRGPSGSLTTPEELYLDLLKRTLTRYQFPELYESIPDLLHMQRLLLSRGLELVRVLPFDPEARAEGRDSPPDAETMIGLKRLDNLQFCITDVLHRKVPGDLIEAGVWRGGATIFMRGVLKAYGDQERIVWAADSFEGLPAPDPKHYPADAGIWQAGAAAVSLEEVKGNFARYGMLDNQVRFLKGFFKDTLPTAPIGRLSVLRVDADMYESTMESLQYLYPKLSVGGYIIIDDYGAFETCKKAVDDYGNAQDITDEIKHIDWTGVFRQKRR